MRSVRNSHIKGLLYTETRPSRAKPDVLVSCLKVPAAALLQVCMDGQSEPCRSALLLPLPLQFRRRVFCFRLMPTSGLGRTDSLPLLRRSWTRRHKCSSVCREQGTALLWRLWTNNEGRHRPLITAAFAEQLGISFWDALEERSRA